MSTEVTVLEKPNTKNRGIVLIAAGHPMYTHMAYNLALSIRNHSNIPIVLAYAGPGITYLFDDQKDIFTDIFEIPKEFYTTTDGRTQWIKTKVHLYDLTPFDETLFLDSDMIFSPFKKVEDLFMEIEENEIQFACRGDKTPDDTLKSEWTNLKDVQRVYGFNHWYELSSEVIYWKQGEIAKEFFDHAIEYYTNLSSDKPLIDVHAFAGGIPDEVPFSLSLESLGIKINSPYAPSYWQPAHFNKITPDVQIQKNYYLISTGGAAVQPNIKRIYSNLTKFNSQKTEKKRAPYPLIAKQNLLAERKKI